MIVAPPLGGGGHVSTEHTGHSGPAARSAEPDGERRGAPPVTGVFCLVGNGNWYLVMNVLRFVTPPQPHTSGVWGLLYALPVSHPAASTP